MENAKVIVEWVDGKMDIMLDGPPLVTLGMLEVATATAMQRFGIAQTGSQAAAASPGIDEAAGD